MDVLDAKGCKIFFVPAEGPPLGSEQDAIDLFGQCWGEEIDMIAVPVARMRPDFFELRNGLLGAFMQKFETYGMRLAVIGDIDGYLAQSRALRDFVYETNSASRHLFVPDREELIARL